MNGAAWGGSEELWYRTAIYAAKKGIRIGCVVYDWKAKENKVLELISAGCIIYRLPNKGRSKNTFIDKLFFESINKLILWFTVKSLPIEKYESVIINQGGFGEVYRGPWENFYKKLRRYFIIFHNYHEEFFFQKKKSILLKEWITNAEKNFFAAGRIVTVLESQLNFCIPRAEVVINPIGFPSPKDVTPITPLLHGNFCFTMLAALDVHRKAQDNLIIALSSEKWKNRNWILNIYGEGKDKNKLQHLIKSKGMVNKIFLNGYADDVRGILKSSHLVFQITHMDAMPVSVVEAMAMSRPLIVSNIGDMPQWVEENLNGWVSKTSPEEINKTLEIAWQKRAQWEEMGKASFKIFKEKYPGSPEEYFLKQLNKIELK